MLHQFIGHLKTITIHKIKVMKLCFACGLYKQGLLHDLSKYSLTEFIPGVRFYQGNRSPISKEKEIIGYSRGWLHHKGRNKHHFEYWIDSINGEFQGVEMEINYVIEMFCDRVAASMVYAKEKYNDDYPLDYFLKNKESYYLMHPNTKNLLESLFIKLKKEGLEKTIHYIRKELLKK